jgi:hypothetical protein
MKRLAAALLCCLALPAQADQRIALPLEPDQPILMKTLDVTASVPAPPWTVTSRIAADSETSRQKMLSENGTNLFLAAYVPKGQDFENWQEIYAVQAERPLAGNAEAHRNQIAMDYQQNCENAVLAPVTQSEERQVFVLYCPSILKQPEVGEMAVMVYSKHADTLLQVSYVRRVPAFDVLDRDSFPASNEEIRELVIYLNKAHLLKS